MHQLHILFMDLMFKSPTNNISVISRLQEREKKNQIDEKAPGPDFFFLPRLPEINSHLQKPT